MLIVGIDQPNTPLGRPVNERLETLGDAWLNYYAGFVIFQARGHVGFCWRGRGVDACMFFSVRLFTRGITVGDHPFHARSVCRS